MSSQRSSTGDEMDALLREIRPSADGIAEYRDVEFSADTLTLGSAPDRTIQLLGSNVAPKHAELRLTQTGVQLTCRRGHTVMIDGKAVASARLSPGDGFAIGGNRLTLLDPPAGFDTGVLIELDPNIDASVFESAFCTDLHQVWFSTRSAAWLSSALVVCLAFIAPLLLADADNVNLAPLSWLPSDALWSSGPLHPAHKLAIGEDCRVCHVKFFQRVQDTACLDCHEVINNHVHKEKMASLSSLGPTPRCATCHREHNEPNPYLVIRADTLCTDCHAESRQRFGDMDTWPVHGFSELSHPAFSAHLLKPVSSRAGTGLVFDWQTIVEGVSYASEMSNLKFPHDSHLDPDLVTDLRNGTALGCNDCHKLSLDREHFVPITMETRCIGCHELTFDPAMPDRQLPHGQPLEVMLTLEGQYLRKFSDPNVPQEAVVRRRIPDRDNTTRECVNTAFTCATEAAAAEIREQFSVRGCISCHVIEEHSSSEIYARYQVHPVRLATDYFPAGRFDHYSHQVMKERTGDAACLFCHGADESSASTDLLLPDIDNCVGCHSDVPAADRVTIRCVDCHSYHPFAGEYTGTIETGQL